jgi:predicted porin
MKKSLIALAALAATASFAQSSVTISGLVDIGYGQVNAPGNNATPRGQTGDISRAAMNGSATTAIIISGTEDLGGGMRALFRYELNPDFVGGSGLTGGAGGQAAGFNAQGASGNTDNNGAVTLGNGANGYNFVGIQTATMGAVRVGRLNTGTLSAWGTGSVFGTALGSGFGTSQIFARSVPSSGANFNNTAPTRFNGAVEWTSPTINSFTARVLFVPQVNVAGAGGLYSCVASSSAACADASGSAAHQLAGANRAGATDVSLAYNKGPLNAMVAQQSVKIGGNGVHTLVSPIANAYAGAAAYTGNYTLTTAAANYQVTPQLRGFAAYWTEKQGAVIDAKSYMLGARYSMGAVDLAISMANNNSKLSSNVDRKILGLGADYNLSKRTAVYARYENRDANTNDNTTDSSTAGATKTTHVGIRHNF